MLRILLALTLSITPALAAQQPVFRGTTPNDNKGDAPYAAFGKLNANDAELYASVATLTTALAGKAASIHTHAIADVTGLQAAIDGKQPLAAPLTALAVTSPSSFGLAWLALSGATPAKTALALSAADVGLGNVANVAPAGLPISTAQAAVNTAQASTNATFLPLTSAAATYASIASPALTGAPTAPTQTAGDNSTKVATTAFVSGALGTAGVVPPGAVSSFATTSCPSGWIENDGAAVARTGTYAGLYAAIGTIWGAGDGSTTFNKPDLRGQFVRGYDHGRGVDSGRALGSTQADMVGPHSHNFGGTAASTGTSLDITGTVGSPYNAFVMGAASGPGGTYIANNSGAETRPKNVAMLSCIKF